jgi:nicotinamidase-related amidase
MSDAVLVVVDVQNGFVSPKSAHIVPAIADLMQRWVRRGRPYVMTRFINEPESPFERILDWHRLTGPPETTIVPELQEYVSGAVAVIDKPIYSMFTPEGAGLVLAQGWRNIVIAGIATESCVLKTAVDAFERGLTPWIVQDASFSHAGQEAHDAGCLVAQRFIGSAHLVSREDLVPRHRGPSATRFTGPDGG